MLQQPHTKYRAFAPIGLKDRTWPDAVITRAPIWLSTDLRDGNQALVEPMDMARKMQMFELLVRIGFKEIEVGFPAASQVEFDFLRRLIDEDRIPDDVTIQVMTPAREELIARTIESLRGAPKAIVHVYNAVAPVWREVVFGMSVSEVMALIERSVSQVRRLTDAQPGTQWTLQYSPETFSLAELEVSAQACETAIAAWGEGKPIILNLPTTVENATPNIFADQIEWMSRRFGKRGNVVISVHPHNDRGTGTASAELAIMAGADRVEGCLFGNGERTGNPTSSTWRSTSTRRACRRASTSRTSTTSAPRSSTAINSPCIRAILMRGTWSTPRSRALTRMRSRRPSRPARTATSGASPTCLSTRRTWAAATRP